MNILQIAGHLGKDPETRFTPSGQKVTNFNVAVNHRKGGKEDVTMWVKVTVWGDRFDKLISYLKKGSAVIAIGEMQPPTMWTDKEGRQQISLDLTADMIKFSPFGKPDRAGEENSTGQTTSYSNSNSNSNSNSQAPYQGNSYSNTHSQSNSGYGGNSMSTYGQQPSQAPADDDALPF